MHHILAAIYILLPHFSLQVYQRIIMQKSILLLTLLFVFFNARAQYYYNDVVSLKATNNIYQALKKNNIQQVVADSREADQTPTQGFVYSRTIKNNASLIATHTELETGGKSDQFETYSNDQLIKMEDSSDNVLTTVEYSYTADGKILSVKTQTDDTAMDVHSTELHKWFYSGNAPDSMIRIKDNADSTIIRFKKDDQQNITEEIWMKKARLIEHYFYYYNDKNQLTDIVRFNTKAQQMLPDYLFEYDDKGMISQLTQVPPGSSDYIIWKYVYDDKDLKTQDVLFDKHQQLLGTVTYTYR